MSPQRTVPDSVEKPDYANGSDPKGENGHTIHIHSAKEISGVRDACKIGRAALDLAANCVRPGITTEAIDLAVHNFCVAQDAYPSPLNYRLFPKSCCTSVNEVICHGIPDARPLEEGDIVNVVRREDTIGCRIAHESSLSAFLSRQQLLSGGCGLQSAARRPLSS